MPAEGSEQQRLFQLVERGELALVEGIEALGFFGKRHQPLHNLVLLSEWRNWKYGLLYKVTADIQDDRAACESDELRLNDIGRQEVVQVVRVDGIIQPKREPTIVNVATGLHNVGPTERHRVCQNEITFLHKFGSFGPFGRNFLRCGIDVFAAFFSITDLDPIHSVGLGGEVILDWPRGATTFNSANLIERLIFPSVAALGEDGLQVAFKQSTGVFGGSVRRWLWRWRGPQTLRRESQQSAAARTAGA